VYFDGSDVGLSTATSEDVDSVSIASNGDIRLSTLGDFSATSGANSLSGNGNQMFACTSPTTGSATACAGLSNVLSLPADTPATDAITIVMAAAPPTGTADLSISKTDGVADVTAGDPVSYTIVVSNAGPDPATGATVTDTLPATLSGVTWTCSAAVGATCAASGNGNLNTTVDLPMGGTATFTVNGTLSAAATGTLVNTATVATPAGVSDPNSADNSATDTDTITSSGVTVQAYFSTTGNTAVPGVAGTSDDADIYAWYSDGSFTRVLDATAVGLPIGANVDGVKVVGNQFYLSFSNDTGVLVPGIGTVQDEDIVVYDTGTSSWSLFFDGSDVGLTSGEEDVDAFDILADGSVIISPVVSAVVPGLAGTWLDEDLLRCVGTFGPTTTCTWSVYFDGSDVGLSTTTNEDVDGVTVGTGALYLSTLGAYGVSGLSNATANAGGDVFSCNTPVTGSASSCASFTLYFRASDHGLTGNLDAISVS
jgi:uncharacterized repeat protein (TIGR01451 family)